MLSAGLPEVCIIHDSLECSGGCTEGKINPFPRLPFKLLLFHKIKCGEEECNATS